MSKLCSEGTLQKELRSTTNELVKAAGAYSGEELPEEHCARVRLVSPAQQVSFWVGADMRAGSASTKIGTHVAEYTLKSPPRHECYSRAAATLRYRSRYALVADTF